MAQKVQQISVTMNVAMPILKDRVAPCFEAASLFRVVRIENDRVVSEKTVECSGAKGFHRVRVVRVHDIDVLICNGIKGFYSDLLKSMGVRVIPDAAGSIAEVLDSFLSGKFEIAEELQSRQAPSHDYNLPELIEWARGHFLNNGYNVVEGPGLDSYLVDLVAEMKCPKCGKDIRVAVCCGVHTYSTEQEIQEFNYCAKAGYNSRVFVYPGDEKTSLQCRAFGIEHVNPETDSSATIKEKCEIPVLTLPVEGHPGLNSGDFRNNRMTK